MIQTVTDVREELTPEVLRIIRVEFEAGQSGKMFNPGAFILAWENLLRLGMGGIWTLSQGGKFIGATGAIAHIDPVEGIMVVAQAFLILVKGYRSPMDANRLMDALEMFARTKNASRILTAVCYDTMDGNQEAFLAAHGYAPYEKRFFKNVWEQKPS